MPTPVLTLRTAPNMRSLIRRLNAVLRNRPDLAPKVDGFLKSFEDIRPGARLPRVLAKLRAARPQLEAAGIRHVVIFGSIARGDDGSQSDIDIVIDAGANPYRTLGELGILTGHIDTLFPEAKVDVVVKGTLPRHLEKAIEKDGVIAF